MTICRNVTESTRLIHGDNFCDRLQRTPGPPVQRGSTILLENCEQVYDPSLVTYGRVGLTTQRTLRDALRDLEHADEAFIYPSGLAAITGTLSALLASGDEVLACDSVYNPTRRYLAGTMARFGVTARYFDSSLDAAGIKAMITPATKLIFLESPGSNTFEMQDIPAIAKMAQEMGVMTAVDNTWSSGVLFKPLDHGVDVSIQSLTKYVCGHSDVFMGLAAAKGKAVELLAKSNYEIGWAVSPDDAYMALRGLRTLHPRLAQHGGSAMKVAQWLAEQPEVHSVLCPGLPQDPGHAIWKRNYSGICGLFSIILNPASNEAVKQMLESLSLFGLGYSWGGFESLILPCDPQLVSRTCCGDFAGPLLRIHVGLEDPDDLISDLRHGLDQITDRPAAMGQIRAVGG
ncbi:MAG: cystathionine beta-lyase [Novosphingobium sp.]|nr:cystathionine beta-lyase [Novosphingobium sp.]